MALALRNSKSSVKCIQMKTNIKESFDIFSYSAGEGHYSGNINKGEIKSPVQEHSSYNWEQNELSLLNS